MAKHIYAPQPDIPTWSSYVNSLKPLAGADPLKPLQNRKDPYGVLALLGTQSAPQSTDIPGVGRTGTGAFGLVPGEISTPSPSDELQQLLPNLGGANSAAMGGILPLLRGQLPPDVRREIENEGATWGVNSGMPGGPGSIAGNRTLADIGLNSYKAQGEGLNRLNSLVGQTRQTQVLDPALQTEINATNATNAAAPNPEAKAVYSSLLYQKYLKKMGEKKGNKLSGALSGATSGAMAGAPLGPWGMAGGAVAGGAMGYFGS